MKYENASLCKRLIADLIDVISVIILSLLIYMTVAFPIGKTTVDFDQNILYQKQLSLDIYDQMYKTHLYIKGKNDQPLDADSIYKRYINNLLDDEKNEDGEYNDPLAYYYITFTKMYSVEEYNKEILDYDGQNNDIFALRDGDINKVATVTSDNNMALNLSEYLKGSNDAAVTKSHQRLLAFFQKAWFKAVENEKGREVISSIVTKYNDSLFQIGLAMGVPAFISVAISILTIYLLIPLFLKNRTLGKKFQNIYILDNEEQEIKVPTLIGRSLVYLVRFAYIPFIVMWLCLGLQNACTVVLIKTASISIPYATVAFMLMGLEIINLFIVFGSRNHRSNVDLITFSKNSQIDISEGE